MLDHVTETRESLAQSFLRQRIATLENERDDLSDRVGRYERLYAAFSAISAAMNEGELAEALLNAVLTCAGFQRAFYFHVDEDANVERVWSLDAPGDEPKESAEEEDALRVKPDAFADFIGTIDLLCGQDFDLDAPLYDTDGFYAAVPVRTREQLVGILYGDKHPGQLQDWETGSLSDLAKHAAITVENIELTEEIEHNLEEMQRLAATDMLTGLMNRRILEERIGQEIERARRRGVSFAYLIIDLDHFKQINDTKGHAAGDVALQGFAKALQLAARKEDVVARFAGDEFVMLMAADKTSVQPAVQRIHRALNDAGFSASIGVALCPYDGRTAEGLYKSADAALYLAKKDGRNTWRFANPAILEQKSE